MSSMELESKAVFVFCAAPGLLTEGWSSLSQQSHRHHYWLVITIAVKTLLQNRRLRWGLPSREVFPWERPACRPAWRTSSGSASSSTSRSIMSSSRSAQWCSSKTESRAHAATRAVIMPALKPWWLVWRWWWWRCTGSGCGWMLDLVGGCGQFHFRSHWVWVGAVWYRVWVGGVASPALQKQPQPTLINIEQLALMINSQRSRLAIKPFLIFLLLINHYHHIGKKIRWVWAKN